MDKQKKIEVLAPAGSYDIMTAVINAGADAVYLGGDMFGARAFAGNFNNEEVIKAIDYAHIHNRKIYLTVNTLLKEYELENMLVKYLKPFYEAGLDAVIVQDLGVLRVIARNFPGLDIHASTQMAIMGVSGARLIKEAKASRIVTAREMNLDEIRDISQQLDIEIESFVHGALCYSYSGQCLFSSMNGSRSGNRGRCAQPCRLEYSAVENKADACKNKGYLLSPKDICTLSILPDIIEAGVTSLKIEGRMKNVTYAAGVTAMYRKYCDLYLKNGRKNYKVADEDINDLMDIYNRGAFTTGYYTQLNGRKMMSIERPNHCGTRALSVVDNKNGCITFRALEEINSSDVFEIDKEHSFSSGGNYKICETFVVNLPRKYNIRKNDVLYRTRNKRIADNVISKYTGNGLKEPIAIVLNAIEGQELELIMQCRDCTVKATGEVVQTAQKQPVTEDRLKSQVSKLGDTHFYLNNFQCNLSKSAFIPMGWLNELRREAADKLVCELTGKNKRQWTGCNNSDARIEYKEANINDIKNIENKKNIKNNIEDKQNTKANRSVLINSIEQIKTIMKLLKDSYNTSLVKRVYIEYTVIEKDDYDCQQFIKILKEAEIQPVIALPHVLRQRNHKKAALLIRRSLDYSVNAFLVRNLEEIGFLSEYCKEHKLAEKPAVVTDAGIYCWNNEAVNEIDEIIKSSELKLIGVTTSFELTKTELKDSFVNKSDNYERELVLFTRIPLMLSQQCVRKTLDKCNGKNDKIILEDKKNKEYYVKSFCNYCYSVIYDKSNLNLTDLKEDDCNSIATCVRYELIDTEGINCSNLKLMDSIFYGDGIMTNEGTYGHMQQGVE